MISVEEALDIVLSAVKVLEPEEKPLLDSLGQVLADDVFSSLDVPPLDSAAMDGYALRSADTRGASSASPRVLRIIGEVAAGYLPRQEVTPGTALRIMTGAPVPKGADAVVPFEDTDEEAQKAVQGKGKPLSQIGVLREVPLGDNIRPTGEDIARGQLVLKKGTGLRPAAIGVLASLGQARAKVIRCPIVAILSTGDELVPVGQELPPGKIYNSNSFSLAAQVRRYGGIPQMLGIAPDQPAALKKKIQAGLGADLFLTSAGISRGDYDVVKDVLAELGEIGFWTVKMKPGKPLAFGLLRRPDGSKVPHLGLPGYPVSSMVTFEQFARPAILKMMGRQHLAKPTVEAVLQGSLKNRDGRRVYARALVGKENGQYYARLAGPQGSAILTTMALANGLAIIPEDVTEAKEGDRVQVQMLDWDEELF